jgi:DedD protein
MTRGPGTPSSTRKRAASEANEERMTTGDAAIRNVEELEEESGDRKTPRAVTFAFVMLGGACVVFAALALGGRRTKPDAPKVDPLGDLVTQKSQADKSPAAKATDLTTKDVTFPGILSDKENPTTALAAVRAGASVAAPGAPSMPPPATDRLPIVPLPAQHVLEASPVVTRPRDSLTRAASDSGQIATAAAPSASAGREGGFQLQVSSFRTQGEAQSFADQLRARGHKAYAIEANVPGRGTWYRVRVGPFATQLQAANYRTSFELKEHVVPFIVPPASALGPGAPAAAGPTH